MSRPDSELELTDREIYDRSWRTEKRHVEQDDEAPSGAPISCVAVFIALFGLGYLAWQVFIR